MYCKIYWFRTNLHVWPKTCNSYHLVEDQKTKCMNNNNCVQLWSIFLKEFSVITFSSLNKKHYCKLLSHNEIETERELQSFQSELHWELNWIWELLVITGTQNHCFTLSLKKYWSSYWTIKILLAEIFSKSTTSFAYMVSPATVNVMTTSGPRGTLNWQVLKFSNTYFTSRKFLHISNHSVHFCKIYLFSTFHFVEKILLDWNYN